MHLFELIKTQIQKCKNDQNTAASVPSTVKCIINYSNSKAAAYWLNWLELPDWRCASDGLTNFIYANWQD